MTQVAFGSIDVNNYDLLNVNHLNSLTVANLVSNSTTSVLGRVASFVDTTGRNIHDSGLLASSLITSNSIGSSVAGHIATFADTSGVLLQDGGAAANFLPLAGGTMNGSVNMGTNNLTNVGGINGVAVSNLVSNSSTSTVNNVAVFSATSGKVIMDSGGKLSDYLALSSLGLNVGTMLSNFTSSNIQAACTNPVGSGGLLVFNSNPSLVGANLTSTLAMNSHAITSVSDMTFSGSALTGTNTMIDSDTTFGDGNYIRFGAGGRNIGVFNGGALFLAFNGDYNTTTNVYNYNGNGTASFLQIDSTGGALQYAGSGTAGSAVSVSNALSWDTTGRVTIPNTLTFGATKGIVGTQTSDSSSSGLVGEYFETDVPSGVSLTSNAITTVCQLVIGPGDFEVSASVLIFPSSTLSAITASTNTVAGSFPAGSNKGLFFQMSGLSIGSATFIPIGSRRYSLSGSTTITLSLSCTFLLTCTAGGNLHAWRRR